MKKRVATVVGARPQFIKAWPLERALAGVFENIFIHTGQHFDHDMSGAFFEELGLRPPDHNLGVGEGMPGARTAAMLSGLERLFKDLRPEAVIVVGDTHSTLAGALAASHSHLPVAHVEAGLRSFNRAMPEEVNRVIVDHVSTWLFAPNAAAQAQLNQEGVRDNVCVVGDIMKDALALFSAKAKTVPLPWDEWGVRPGAFYLATIHRAGNTDDPQILAALMSALESLDKPVLFPVHPRTRNRLNAFSIKPGPRTRLLPPQGYLAVLALQTAAAAVLTDSGGMQKEAYYLGVPCVTLREETEWPETVAAGWNRVAGHSLDRIRDALERPWPGSPRPELYGDGHAAEKIRDILLNPATWPGGKGH